MAAAPTSEIVLGIDLGTSYSTAAAVVDGRIHYALDSRGEACIPSVVHFPKSGPPLVGFEADKLRSTDPQNTVFGIKRLIGRPADSPAARLLDAASAFKIKAQPGAEAAIQIRNGQYTASEIAAMLLRSLRERAEARFQKKITKAVVTVPVTATQPIREAMIKCGKMAGLEILRIIAEPVAGALSRGATNLGAAPLVVYDFGGGTFDATVVQAQGKQLRVLSAGGDDCLGGDDFDLAFARWIADTVYRMHNKQVTTDVILWDRIQRTCEKVKRALSTAKQAPFRVPDAFGSGARAQSLDFLIDRDHLSPHWTELVERSIQCTADTIAQANVPVEAVGSILMIGGTSFVPQVRERVAEAFARPCVLEDDPQTAVARGAAILAAQAGLLAA